MSSENIRPIDSSLTLQQHEGSKKVEWMLNRIEKKVIEPAHIDFPEAYKAKFIEAIKNPNIIPFVYANHYDHTNGLAMIMMSGMFTDLINQVRGTEKPFEGFWMPVSASALNGNQGSFLKDLIEHPKAKFYLEKYHTNIVGCATENDKKQRNTDGINTTLVRRILRIVHYGNGGIAILPEGSVEGGRRIKEGENKGHRKGLQKFDSDFINLYVKVVASEPPKELLYVPLGLSGPNLIHTDHRSPTIIGIQTLAARNPKSIIDIRVGEPITHTELMNEVGKDVTKETFSNHLRGKVVALLPPDFLPPEERK